MTRREAWVEVPLTDGQMLMGSLVLRDAERVVLRAPHWIWLALPDPVTESLPTPRPWQDFVEIDNSEVVMVCDVHAGMGQKWDIVSFPAPGRVRNPRWVSKKRELSTRIYPPKHPSMTLERARELRPAEYD